MSFLFKSSSLCQYTHTQTHITAPHTMNVQRSFIKTDSSHLLHKTRESLSYPLYYFNLLISPPRTTTTSKQVNQYHYQDRNQVLRRPAIDSEEQAPKANNGDPTPHASPQRRRYRSICPHARYFRCESHHLSSWGRS